MVLGVCCSQLALGLLRMWEVLVWIVAVDVLVEESMAQSGYLVEDVHGLGLDREVRLLDCG